MEVLLIVGLPGLTDTSKLHLVWPDKPKLLSEIYEQEATNPSVSCPNDTPTWQQSFWQQRRMEKNSWAD